MHFLVGIGVLAALITFVLGEGAARAFVGVVLAVAALLVLLIVTVTVRDSVAYNQQRERPITSAEGCMPADAHWQYPIRRCEP